MRRNPDIPSEPIERAKYLAYKTKERTAKSNNIPFELTFEEFKEIWKNNWRQRGTTVGSYVMTRHDPTKPWNKENTILVKREKGNNSYMGPHATYSTKHEKQQHLDYARMKAQAKFRNEPFLITFEEFKALWADKWDQRGRKSYDYCLSRENPNLPWDNTNTILITRKEQLSTKFQKRHNNE